MSLFSSADVAKLGVYSVRDSKMGNYGPIMLFPNDAVALRQFSDSVRGGKSAMMSAHPEDFNFYRVGYFVESTGDLIPCKPDHVGSALDVSLPVGN